jgi:uncharacterized protein with HEPN domain
LTIDPKLLSRLQFLTRVIRKESQHLATTDQRLYAGTKTITGFDDIDTDIDLAERIDAFVSRFCRLQDTLGDKLLPRLLAALGEHTAYMIDNLDRAENLGLIKSAEEWMAMRSLRNQMVHEYVEDKLVLASALITGHLFVPTLIATANTMIAEMEHRGWVA